jgi:hypothetical protein
MATEHSSVSDPFGVGAGDRLCLRPALGRWAGRRLLRTRFRASGERSRDCSLSSRAVASFRRVGRLQPRDRESRRRYHEALAGKPRSRRQLTNPQAVSRRLAAELSRPKRAPECPVSSALWGARRAYRRRLRNWRGAGKRPPRAGVLRSSRCGGRGVGVTGYGPGATWKERPPVTPPSHTAPGARAPNERVELARYTSSAGERVTYGQRVPGVVGFLPGATCPSRGVVALQRGRQVSSSSSAAGGRESGGRGRGIASGAADPSPGAWSAHGFAGDARRCAGVDRSEGQHGMTWGDLEVAEHARERGSRPELAAGGAREHVQGVGSAVFPRDDEGPGAIADGPGAGGVVPRADSGAGGPQVPPAGRFEAYTVAT